MEETITVKFIVGWLLLCSSLAVNFNFVDGNSSLKQVLLVHRHGDRTPIVFPSRDPLRNKPFWSSVGLSSLTNDGKARLHRLGMLIRDIYSDFLTDNRHEVLSRSSGAERCVESGQLFLSGLYKPDKKSDQIWDNPQTNPLSELWLPIKIRSAPIQFDGMLAEGCKCNNLQEEYEAINGSAAVKTIYQKYDGLAKMMKEQIDFDYPIFFNWFYASSLIDVEKQYFPDELNPVILDSYDLIDAAGKEAMAAWISTDRSKRLRTGLLINDLLSKMLDYQEGKTDIKFVHYSAHDLTIVALLGVLNLFKDYPDRPGYGSSIVMELHQENTGEKFVKFFYLLKEGGEIQQVEFESCSKLSNNRECYLSDLVSILEPYTITSWSQWMTECANTGVIDVYDN